MQCSGGFANREDRVTGVHRVDGNPSNSHGAWEEKREEKRQKREGKRREEKRGEEKREERASSRASPMSFTYHDAGNAEPLIPETTFESTSVFGW